MKRKTAKEILADSFRELAQDLPVDKITVRDITANCGYSLATFYRQFKDKYDLIAWSYTRDLDTILAQLRADENSWRQVLERTAEYFQTHRKYLSNLLTHTSGYDSFIVNMTGIHCRCMEKVLTGLTGTGQIDALTGIYVRIYCSGSVLFSCDWILGKYNLNVKELAKVYENALPEPLRQYFR